MAISANILLSIIYFLIAWGTVTSVILLLSRRDVKLGLKKWWMIKRKRQPIALRFYGPDLNVREEIVATRGQGDSITIDSSNSFFLSNHEGSTFFLDEDAIRRRDDGVNEINFSYKSVMPIVPDSTLADVHATRQAIEDVHSAEAMAKAKADTEAAGKEFDEKGYKPVKIDNLVLYTDPKRLNRLIEFIKLAAKADALIASDELLKYVKYAGLASAAAALGVAFVWYTMDGTMLPLIQHINAVVGNIGSTVLSA